MKNKLRLIISIALLVMLVIVCYNAYRIGFPLMPFVIIAAVLGLNMLMRTDRRRQRRPPPPPVLRPLTKKKAGDNNLPPEEWTFEEGQRREKARLSYEEMLKRAAADN